MKISRRIRIPQAIAHLQNVDPKLAAVIHQAGRCNFKPRAEGTHFGALARSIVYQQLSGKAASTIHGRFVGLFENELPEPHALLKLSDETLRGVGLSRQKTGYLRDLATRAHSGDLPVESLHELSDEEVLETLVQVKGIGRWTAQIFLMFRLGRPDILPELDLGIQKAIQKAYRLRQRPTPKRVLQISAKWAPHRSVAAWYLWHWLDEKGPIT
jgi:DNA-3-methyladenine glycosylase II